MTPSERDDKFLSQKYVRIYTIFYTSDHDLSNFRCIYICMFVYIICIYNMHRELDKSCVSIYIYNMNPVFTRIDMH